jgi:hypothetical protein
MEGRANNSAEVDLHMIRAELVSRMGQGARYYPRHTERRFPHIVVRIATLWGKAELDAYLKDLMITTRVGRQGFPPEVAQELFMLASAHGSLGLSTAAAVTGWGHVEDQDIYRRAVVAG